MTTGPGRGMLRLGAVAVVAAGLGAGAMAGIQAWLAPAPQPPVPSPAPPQVPRAPDRPVAKGIDVLPAMPAPPPVPQPAAPRVLSPPPAPPAAAVAQTPSAPVPGALRAAACPSLSLAGPAPRCATMRAALDWNAPDGTAIDIFVTVLPALGPGHAEDPVVVLSGGPGQAGSDEAAAIGAALEPVRRNRDVVLVDQRGTGRSVPSLRCPAIGSTEYWYGGVTAQAVRGCLEPVRRAGYDLARFDTTQSAGDLAALRAALGVARWNVVATSYGGVLADALMKVDGAAVRSLVLNSPATAEATWLDRDRFAALRDAHARMAEDCAAQPDCARAFPDLAQAVPRLAHALAGRPLPMAETVAGGPVRPLRWDWIAPMVGMRLGVGTGVSEVPALLARLGAVAAAPQPPDPAAVRRLLLPPALAGAVEQLAYGLNLIIGCRENRPAVDAERARAAAAEFWPWAAAGTVETDYDVACPALGLPPVDPAFYEPAAGEVPTLILTGAYDTVVAPSRVAALKARMPRALLVGFRGIGHDVLGASGCARAIAAAFVGDPQTPPPLDCSERFLPPTFDTDRPMP